jgi:hypothetical protein
MLGGLLRLSSKMPAVTAAMLFTFAGVALADPVEVLWLGHSAFRITSTAGKVIVIDPFLTKNPRTPAKYKDLENVGAPPSRIPASKARRKNPKLYGVSSAPPTP